MAVVYISFIYHLLYIYKRRYKILLNVFKGVIHVDTQDLSIFYSYEYGMTKLI